MCHYDLDCHPIFMSLKKKKKKKGLSKIQALPIWKRENPPWNTFKSNITALGAVCCVSEFFCVLFFFIFVDTQPNVNETSGYFQHEYSKVWQQNIIQLSEKYQQQTSSFDLSPSEMKAVGFFFLELSFCTNVEIIQGKRGYSSSKLFLLLPPHWKPQPEDEVMWGKLRESEQTEEAKKTTVAWQRQPTIFFVFAYCRLARLNRHIARERSHFNRWLAVLLFAQTSLAASHWTRGSSLWAPLVVWNTTAAMETFVSLPKYIFKEIGGRIATLFWNTSYNLLRFCDN